MRQLFIIGAAVVVASGCASKPKPQSTAAAAVCPPLTGEQWGPPVHAARARFFEPELQRRFGETGSHFRLEHSTDSSGNRTILGQRIGPWKYDMPEPGKGGEFRIVLRACDAKVLKVEKLADLEAAPRPIRPNQDDET